MHTSAPASASETADFNLLLTPAIVLLMYFCLFLRLSLSLLL